MKDKVVNAKSALGLVIGFFLLLCSLSVSSDETCMSPYMAKIVGQEDYVYVWTLGMEGMGDAQDKLVTIDVNPRSSSYGEIVASLSVGGRNEAHHSGLTDDRQYLWAAGLDTNKIFIFDVASDPAKPRLHKTITDFVAKTGGAVGPHTTYAMPGRMLVTALSNERDHGGETAMAEYTNEGEHIATYWMPKDGALNGAVKSGKYADGFGYDIRALPQKNVLVTSSFTGWNNYMMDLGKMMADPQAMAEFGNTAVIWDLHTRKPKRILDVPGAPLEIRCAWDPAREYCFTTTALTSKIWLIHEVDGVWQAKEVADIGDASKIPLPVDISISADDQKLWVNTWNDGQTRLFDISNPHEPKEILTKKIGDQVNMVSQSWDGKRLYYTSSLLGNWDKKSGSKGNVQYFKAYTWNGQALVEQFSIDFLEKNLGRPHQMRFGAKALYANLLPRSEPTNVASLQR